MRTRGFAVALTLMLFLVFSPVAMADIVGSWDVIGSMKTKVKIKGHGSETVVETVADSFEFNASGGFSTLDFDQATWDYVGKKAFVAIDQNDLEFMLETQMEELFENEGYSVGVSGLTIIKNILFAKDNIKKGTINGKWTMVFTCRIELFGQSLYVTANVNYKFTGMRESVTSSFPELSSLPEDEELRGTLPEAVFRQIQKQISELLPQR